VKIKILAIGKPKLAHAAMGVEDYAKRLKRHLPVEVVYGKAGTAQSEGEWLLAQSEGSWRVVLDERGREWASAEWAEKLSGWEMRSLKRVCFLIGGADGHRVEVREQASELWSLSRMTLQHELALVLLLEQLYRAGTIRRGEPYHRG
jgi:23S rRNA (pseudouridine1915-N3)-methyltransferase